MNSSRHLKLFPLARKQKGRHGFTMIEIAIAIAVIGFALVAIIGVLPTGLNSQKDNREETIVNQDGPYLLEAIRGGEHRIDLLTNYFDSITVETIGTGVYSKRIYTNDLLKAVTGPGDWLTNGEVIIGLLTTPKYLPNPLNKNEFITNNVTASVRATVGSALEQVGPMNTSFANNTAIALNYFLRSEIVNYNAFDVERTNWFKYVSDPNNPTCVTSSDITNCLSCSNYWWQAQVLSSNLYEVRLKISWPLLPNGNIGPNRQVFRTMVSAKLEKSGIGDQLLPGATTNEPFDNLYFFQPEKYTPSAPGS